MPADRALLIQKLDLLRRAAIVELEHAEVLRWALQDDDVEAMQRGLRGLNNAREMVSDLATEIGHELPDWRPVEGPDGYSGISGARNPDAHLGAAELRRTRSFPNPCRNASIATIS